jgi:hypothetical protein
VKLVISDAASLVDTCGWLQDARFALPDAVFDEAAHIWRGTFLREGLEDPALLSRREGVVFAKTTYPLVEAVLELEGVRDCVVDDRSRIESYYFRICEPVADGFRLVFAEDMEITLSFDGPPRGSLADVGVSDEVGTLLGLKWLRGGG